MKLIIAVIQPTKLSAVCESLEQVEVQRMTVCDAQGFGRQQGRSESYPGKEPTTALIRKVVLEVVVNDDFFDQTIRAITSVARSGSDGAIGDGKIFVLPTDEAIQIDDAARGPGAV